jgi:hypothetical protein
LNVQPSQAGSAAPVSAFEQENVNDVDPAKLAGFTFTVNRALVLTPVID